ncbi:MAG: MGH1-like glycoside hydrolase domain-containing protein [Phycisphaerae bacterium]
MKPTLLLPLLLITTQLHAQSPQPDDDASLIQSHILHDYPGMLHQPTGQLAHPFITPGSVYAKELWDWDSWLSDIALLQILTDEGNTDHAQMLSYGQGCVLNFLAAATPDGFIPIRLQINPKQKPTPHNPAHNMHKPVLAQHAAFLVQLDKGNAEWLRQEFPTLQKFEAKYRNEQFHPPTGLYFWKDDLAIGVDNDPATFFRPPNSSASIFLNCLMFKELLAMAYLAQSLHLDPSITAQYTQQAADLKAAIQKNCWDERDGYFYSVDLNLLPITTQPADYLGAHFTLHKGHPRDYECLIQRLESWTGMMAMWAQVATPEQAKRMVNERYKNPNTLFANFGIRSLSKQEKMYALYPSSNPSNWNGPIWGISNYLTFRALLNYGFTTEANDLADKTIHLFAMDYQKSHTLHEYYNPDTGAPIINPNFQNWNYLVTNILAWKQHRPTISEF